MIAPKSKEEIFATSVFEWVKTERQGDICHFLAFDFIDGVEYVLFNDGTRISVNLIGDVVLRHDNEQSVLGVKQNLDEDELFRQQMQIGPARPVANNTNTNHHVQQYTQVSSPVQDLLDKSKKHTEKLSLEITVKIPSPDLYNVLKESFTDVEKVLIDSIATQIEGAMIRTALRNALNNIYGKKKKTVK